MERNSKNNEKTHVRLEKGVLRHGIFY